MGEVLPVGLLMRLKRAQELRDADLAAFVCGTDANGQRWALLPDDEPREPYEAAGVGVVTYSEARAAFAKHWREP